MARVCSICGKSKATGFQISHSHIKTKRKWLPNIHRIRIIHKGSPRRMNVCTRCLKANKQWAL